MQDAHFEVDLSTGYNGLCGKWKGARASDGWTHAQADLTWGLLSCFPPGTFRLSCPKAPLSFFCFDLFFLSQEPPKMKSSEDLSPRKPLGVCVVFPQDILSTSSLFQSKTLPQEVKRLEDTNSHKVMVEAALLTAW